MAMSTTALVVEHLITGLQATVWLSLLVLTVFGFDWLNLSEIRGFTTLLTLIWLAAAYPLGIVMDELADFCFKRWSRKIRAKRFTIEGLSLQGPDLTVFNLLQKINDDFSKSYFNYIRMRIRISRSTALNFLLITLFSMLFTAYRLNSSPKLVSLLISEFLVGGTISILAIWAWREISDTFARQIARAFKANPHLSSGVGVITSRTNMK